MANRGGTSPVVWVLAAIGALALLPILFFVAINTAGVALMIPVILLSMAIPFAFSIIAFLDLWRIVRDHNGGRWDTVDVLWAVGFFVFQIIAPLAWLIVGRGTRLRELGVERAPTEP